MDQVALGILCGLAAGVVIAGFFLIMPARVCPTCGATCPKMGRMARKCPVCDAK